MKIQALNSTVWKVFSSPIRQQIIKLLETRAHTTGELCDSIELSRFAVMQHLKVLEQAGLIQIERRGRYRWNTLRIERLAALKQALSEELSISGSQQTQGRIISRPHIKLEYRLPAPPSIVFAALTIRIGEWWNDDDRATVILEPWVGGRFWKRFTDRGNGVLLGTVDKIWHDEFLGFHGSMGSDNIINIVRFGMEAFGEEQTTLTLSHHYSGEVDVIAHDAFEQSWQDLIGTHLISFLSR